MLGGTFFYRGVVAWSLGRSSSSSSLVLYVEKLHSCWFSIKRPRARTHATDASISIRTGRVHAVVAQSRLQSSQIYMCWLSLFSSLSSVVCGNVGIQNMLLNLQQTQHAQHLQSQLQQQQQQQQLQLQQQPQPDGLPTNSARTPQTITRPEPMRLEAIPQELASPDDDTGGGGGGGGGTSGGAGGGNAAAASDKSGKRDDDNSDSEPPTGQQRTPKRLERKKARVPKTEDAGE